MYSMSRNVFTLKKKLLFQFYFTIFANVYHIANFYCYILLQVYFFNGFYQKKIIMNVITKVKQQKLHIPFNLPVKKMFLHLCFCRYVQTFLELWDVKRQCDNYNHIVQEYVFKSMIYITNILNYILSMSREKTSDHKPI